VNWVPTKVIGSYRSELSPNKPTLNAHIGELGLNIPKLSPNKGECLIIGELGPKTFELNKNIIELGTESLECNQNRNELVPNKFELGLNK
jgi:hypothetical protein